MENAVWEFPYAASVNYSYFTREVKQCFVCFKGCPDPVICADCENAFYCSQKCLVRDRDETLQHKYECRAFQATNGYELDLQLLRKCYDSRLVARILVRMSLDGGKSAPEDYSGFEKLGPIRTVADLLSHEDKFIDEIWVAKWKLFDHFYTVQEDSPFVGVTKEKFLEIFGKIRTNSFSIRAPCTMYDEPDPVAVAVYLQTSRFDHSCDPSIKRYWQDDKIILTPFDKSMKMFESPSNDLRISYKCWDGTIASKHDRQEVLRLIFHFICDCKKCADNDADITAWNGLKETCAKCQGLLVPNVPDLESHTYLNPKCFLPLMSQSDMICLKCNKRQGTVNLEQFHNEMKNAALSSTGSTFGGYFSVPPDLMSHYKSLSKIELLSPVNAWVILAYETFLTDRLEPKLNEKVVKKDDKVANTDENVPTLDSAESDAKVPKLDEKPAKKNMADLLLAVRVGEIIVAGYEYHKLTLSCYPIMCAKIGMWYREIGNIDGAKKWYEKAKKLWSEFFSADHDCVAQIDSVLKQL